MPRVLTTHQTTPMEMHIKYQLGANEHYARQEFSSGKDPTAKPNYFRPAAVVATPGALGMIAAFKAQSPSLLAILSICAIAPFVEAIRESLRWHKAVIRAIESTPTRSVSLTILEDGLHEVVEGIESFAPWTSVRSFFRFKHIFSIELADGSSAIIPLKSLSALRPSAEQELVNQLKASGATEQMG